MTVSPDDLHPIWWTVIVVILDILLSSIMVTGLFLIPETMFLEQYDIQDLFLLTMFCYIAWSNACGDALVILICCFEVTTKGLSILKICNTFIYAIFLCTGQSLFAFCEWDLLQQAKCGCGDPIGDPMDYIDLLLPQEKIVVFLSHCRRRDVFGNQSTQCVVLEWLAG
jgi:hypothetical protein